MPGGDGGGSGEKSLSGNRSVKVIFKLKMEASGLQFSGLFQSASAAAFEILFRGVGELERTDWEEV